MSMTNPISRIVSNIDLRRELIVTVVSFLSLIACLAWAQPFVAALSSVVLFGAMDAIGYYRVGEFFGENRPQDKLVYYRILQTVFQHLITAVLFIAFGWQIAGLYLLMWWFGVADIVYYIILRQSYLQYGSMFWLWWTPLGITMNILNRAWSSVPKYPSGILATVQADFGIVLAVVLYLLFL